MERAPMITPKRAPGLIPREKREGELVWGEPIRMPTPNLERRLEVLEAKLAEVRARPLGTPPAPEWLPQFAETQIAGQPITKARTRTPSGQLYAQTPWSVREGLRGYTEWAGYRPYSEILEHMLMMQPEAPMGAGRVRWQPPAQFA